MPCLQSAEPRCRCNRPENPDKDMILCPNEKCKKWLHQECLIHETLLAVYRRLGSDKPHNPAPKGTPSADTEAQQPLSPSESGAAPTAQASIDVASDAQVAAQSSEGERASSVIQAHRSAPSTPTPDGTLQARPRKSIGSKPAKRPTKDKPYQGLFEAEAIPPEPEDGKSATALRVTDLREKVTGGDKTWTVPLTCLMCSTAIA